MLPIQGAPTLKESTVLLAEQLRYFSCDRLPAAVVHSAAGAWPSRFELQMLKRIFPSTELYAPKAILGESLAPSSLWQLILALDLASGNRANAPVLVSVLGYQGGAAAVRVDV